MRILKKTIYSLTQATRWVGMAIILVMMTLIAITVLSRSFDRPILGDVELVQLSMIVIIMFGLAYTQAENGHISIGLLVDRLPPRVQLLLDVFALALTTFLCWLISWVFYNGAIKEMLGAVIKTDLLSIPQYPFKFIIALGLFLWGLECFFKIILAIIKLVTGDIDNSKDTKGADELWL